MLRATTDHLCLLVVVVFENGKSGFLGEHSCMDGTPTLRMTEFILGALAAGKINLGTPRSAETASSLAPPTEIKFELDAKTAKNIATAEADFDKLVGEHDMEVLQFDAYGKEYIKKFKASPDAWAQLVKQLAFHKMFGRPGVCYESAQTRKFQLGRTEVIRAASNESKAWAEAMLDPKATVSSNLYVFSWLTCLPAAGVSRLGSIPSHCCIRFAHPRGFWKSNIEPELECRCQRDGRSRRPRVQTPAPRFAHFLGVLSS